LNVVFDLGGVVFRWQPDVLVRGVFDDPRTRDAARTGILEHADWIELDRGTISQDEAVARACRRTGLSQPDVERLFRAVPPHLTPVDATVALIRAVKTAGHRAYVLSNMHLASISHLEREYDIWSLFDGAVISCRVKAVKPEPAIYEHLLNEHRLNAAETMFIDDREENLETASAFGIHPIHFIDAAQCREALGTLGCIDVAVPAAPASDVS